MAREARSFVYKVASGCRIEADVYRREVGQPSPVVVWIHGGALIAGSRGHLPAGQRDRYLEAGYHVVSIDYRLAPETKLPAILDDLADAFRWVREEGPRLFAADPGRVAAVGHSAGGYLALMAGVLARPRAVVSFYGYGDIVGAWYSQPDPHYCQQPRVSEEEARASVGGPPLSGSDWGLGRERFYLYCRQQGRWPLEVGGRDPHREPEAFALWCPVRNVTTDYPPTMLLHGDQDADVPYQQSELMAAALSRAGVPHELVTIQGGGHGFDHDLRDPTVASAFDRVLAFLAGHV